MSIFKKIVDRWPSAPGTGFFHGGRMPIGLDAAHFGFPQKNV